MQFYGVKTPELALNSKRIEFSSKGLNFSALVSSARVFSRNVDRSCKNIALRVTCEAGRVELLERKASETFKLNKTEKKLTCVMKFGGSSVASAERMIQVAKLILSFPDEKPVVVLSAMAKTTNKLLMAGEKAVCCGVTNVDTIEELSYIKELHIRTAHELGVETAVIAEHLEGLEQLLKGVAMMKELTLRSRDYLVSFGECMSTRLFAAYLNKIGHKARQYDAFEIGIITTDDFTNADILEATYPAVSKKLLGDWSKENALPVVTGFLGKVYKITIDYESRARLVVTFLEFRKQKASL